MENKILKCHPNETNNIVYKTKKVKLLSHFIYHYLLFLLKINNEENYFEFRVEKQRI